MPLKIRCPCGTKLVVSSRYAGRRVKCPKCNEPVEIPALAEQPSPPDAKVAPPVAAAGTAAGPSRSTAMAPPKTPDQTAADLVPVPAPPPAPAAATVKPPSLRTQTAVALSSDVVEPKPPPVQGATAGPKPPPPPVNAAPSGDRNATPGLGASVAKPIAPVTKPIAPAGRSEKADPVPTDTKQKSPRATPPEATRRPPTPPPRPASKPIEASSTVAPQPRPLDGKAPPAKPHPPAKPRPPAEPHPPAESHPPAVTRPGYQPSEDQLAIVRAIGISLAAVAVISAIPAVLDIIDHIRAEASPGVARWAYLVLMLAVLQSAYSAYVYQLPDWSTVWVVTLVTLVIATGYAMMLGLTFITHGDAWLVSNLDLGDVFRGGRASLWCFVMLCLTSLVSYFSGRISVRWRSELVAT